MVCWHEQCAAVTGLVEGDLDIYAGFFDQSLSEWYHGRLINRRGIGLPLIHQHLPLFQAM